MWANIINKIILCCLKEASFVGREGSVKIIIEIERI
jgi:hypothetical protein